MIAPTALRLGGLDGKLPVDFDLFGTLFFQERQDFVVEAVDGCNPTIQTQAVDHPELVFNHIKTDGAFRRVDEN